MCSVPGCNDKVYALGDCRKHYRQARRSIGLEAKYVSSKICKIDGCTKTVDCHDMCNVHYGRWRAHGDPLKLLRQPVPERCSIDGCDKPMVDGSGRGYCPMHYQRWRLYGDPLVESHRTDLLDRSAPCEVPDCTNIIGKYGNKGMCRYHARKLHRAARPKHYLAVVNARRHRVREATPPWADVAAIEAFYAACPAGYEVDHFFPLRGRNRKGSGLNTLENLQYLTIEENRRKGNRWPTAAEIAAYLTRPLSYANVTAL
jgi:hypothetical protein